ncbi:MAG: sensor histidine kinase [Steroidobacteraceae bacterium]
MLEYLCIILPVAVLALAHVLRVRYLNQQLQKSLEQRLEDRIKERTRIARELHDSLLQGFQGTMFRLEAVRRLLPDRLQEAAHHLDVAIDRGLAAINEGRQAVGELRMGGPVGTDLPQALADLGSEFEPENQLAGNYRGAAPNFRVLVQGQPIALKPIVRDEVYRIAREAVRNSFRHARAGLVEVEIVFGEAAFTARVRDDGIGLEPAVLEHGYRKGHWGLPGMRERALEFGGELEVWSQRNTGTEIELKIDARIAYVRRLARRPPNAAHRGRAPDQSGDSQPRALRGAIAREI